MNRRVVVSGLGVISPLGQNSEAHWQAIREGRSAIGPLETVNREGLNFSNGAEIRGFDPLRWFDERLLLQLDRTVQFLLVAAREAICNARLEGDPRFAERTAVITGTGLGGKTTEEKGYLDVYGGTQRRVHPLTIPRAMASAGASQLAMSLAIGGPAFTISTACSSSSHAIGMAFWLVRQGVVDLALAGGSEAPFCWGHLKAWESLRTIAPDTCRPFSRDRRGMILGEGAAVLVLEPMETAVERGAPIQAEVIGFGMSSDAYHLTQPSALGAARAIRAALGDAELSPNQVDYINAHGTGTAANDPTETRAIRMVFESHADRLSMSSTKSMHGHTLGAAGAIEAATTVFALRDSTLPPTANFTEPDPECDLDVVPNTARHAPLHVALSNSFAFGGLNSVLAFREYR